MSLQAKLIPTHKICSKNNRIIIGITPIFLPGRLVTTILHLPRIRAVDRKDIVNQVMKAFK